MNCQLDLALLACILKSLTNPDLLLRTSPYQEKSRGEVALPLFLDYFSLRNQYVRSSSEVVILQW
jgi:hypothetical protein